MKIIMSSTASPIVAYKMARINAFLTISGSHISDKDTGKGMSSRLQCDRSPKIKVGKMSRDREVGVPYSKVGHKSLDISEREKPLPTDKENGCPQTPADNYSQMEELLNTIEQLGVKLWTRNNVIYHFKQQFKDAEHQIFSKNREIGQLQMQTKLNEEKLLQRLNDKDLRIEYYKTELENAKQQIRHHGKQHECVVCMEADYRKLKLEFITLETNKNITLNDLLDMTSKYELVKNDNVVKDQELENIKATMEMKESGAQDLLNKWATEREKTVELEDHVINLKADIKNREHEINRICGEINEERHKHHSKIQAKDHDLQVKDHELQYLKTELQEHMKRERYDEISELKKRLLRKDSELKKILQENKRLETAIVENKSEDTESGKQWERDRCSLESKIQTLESELSRKDQLLQNGQTKIETNSGKGIRQLQDEMTRMGLENNKNLRELNQQNQNLQLEVETYKRKIESLNRVMKKEQEEHFNALKLMEAEISSKKQVFEQLQAKCTVGRDENKEKLEELHKQNQHLKKDLNSREAAIKELKATERSNAGKLQHYGLKLQTAETLMEENQLMKHEIDALKQQAWDLEETLKQQESIYLTQIDQYKRKTAKLGHQLELKQECSNIQLHELSKLVEKDRKIEELSNRLATEMSTKISSDERALENVSVKNRPMNIASEYEMICSNEWHDAKNEIDEMCPRMIEDDKIKLLMSVFEESESEAKKRIEALMLQFHTMLDAPFTKSSSSQLLLPDAINKEVRVFIGDRLRNNADSADVTSLFELIKQKIGSIHYSMKTNQNFYKFVHAAARVAWKMVLQRPLMHFRQIGVGEKWQGENKQELFWSSSDPSNAHSRVKYYVHPALYHGESMMVKGRVLLAKC